MAWRLAAGICSSVRVLRSESEASTLRAKRNSSSSTSSSVPSALAISNSALAYPSMRPGAQCRSVTTHAPTVAMNCSTSSCCSSSSSGIGHQRLGGPGGQLRHLGLDLALQPALDRARPRTSPSPAGRPPPGRVGRGHRRAAGRPARRPRPAGAGARPRCHPWPAGSRPRPRRPRPSPWPPRRAGPGCEPCGPTIIFLIAGHANFHSRKRHDEERERAPDELGRLGEDRVMGLGGVLGGEEPRGGERRHHRTSCAQGRPRPRRGRPQASTGRPSTRSAASAATAPPAHHVVPSGRLGRLCLGAAAAVATFGDLGVDHGQAVLSLGLQRLAGGVDAAVGLGPHLGQLGLVVGDFGLGRGPGGIGGLQVPSDQLVAGVHALLEPREEEQPDEDGQHDERAGTPQQLLALGQDGARALVQLLLRGRWLLTSAARTTTCGRPDPSR